MTTYRIWSVAAALLAMAVAGCNQAAGPTVQASDVAPPVPVTVAPVELRDLERTVDVVGTLKGWEEVTVGTKRFGRVAKILHDMGDRVRPGETLVELETVDAELAIEESHKRLDAELAMLGLSALPPRDFDVAGVPSVVQSRVALERSQQNLARERSLSHRGAGTVQDLQNAESDAKSAEAALENAVVNARSTLASAQAAKVALDQARQARIDMEIRAPVPSTVPKGQRQAVVYAITKRKIAEGQMIKEGDPVAELAIENPLKLWASVPERYSAEIAPGELVRITVPAHPGRPFEGRASRINPAVDPTSRTFEVEVVVPNDQRLLKPGGFAKASILTRSQGKAKTVPLESVVNYAGVSKLFIIEQDHARAIEVETGLEGPGWVEVIGPVPDSAQVVTSNQTVLADRTPVTIRQPESDRAGDGPKRNTSAAGVQ